MAIPYYRGLVASPRQTPPLLDAQYDIMLVDGDMLLDCTYGSRSGVTGFVAADRSRCVIESEVHIYLLRQLPTP